jgi:hypothetical protein
MLNPNYDPWLAVFEWKITIRLAIAFESSLLISNTLE